MHQNVLGQESYWELLSKCFNAIATNAQCGPESIIIRQNHFSYNLFLIVSLVELSVNQNKISGKTVIMWAYLGPKPYMNRTIFYFLP